MFHFVSFHKKNTLFENHSLFGVKTLIDTRCKWDKFHRRVIFSICMLFSIVFGVRLFACVRKDLYNTLFFFLFFSFEFEVNINHLIVEFFRFDLILDNQISIIIKRKIASFLTLFLLVHFLKLLSNFLQLKNYLLLSFGLMTVLFF